MSVWNIAGKIAIILWALFFLWFCLVNLFEKEKKAFVRSALFLIFFVLLNILLFFVPPILASTYFTGVFFLSLLFFVWLFISPAPRKGIIIVGRQEKIDERDVIFARFDYQEGTRILKDYYARRPEFESVDSQIRQLPDLFDHSHNTKNPVLFSLAAAEFDFLEHQLTQVDGTIKPVSVTSKEEENAKLIKRLIDYLGSDHCGIAALNQSYVYSHVGRGPEDYGKEIHLDHEYAIVFAVEMELAMVGAAPRAPVVVETGKQYVQAARISIIAANFIRRIGFPARAHIAGSNYQAVIPPLGWEAGLGELGRIGTLITSKFGPRARLGLITTSLPLKPDKPKISGIQEFCEKCQKCATNCPAQAIPRDEKKEENGVLKWVLDREECYRYWRKAGTDCAICMYVCPYSKPNNLFHNSIRALASQSSLAQSISVWADDFFYGRRPMRKKDALRVLGKV